MASPEHILRIRRGDSDDDFILLNVSSNGPTPPDLRLLATEGDNPYATYINFSRISKLRDQKSVQNDSEWQNTLLTTLLQQSPTTTAETPDQKEKKSKADEKIEIVASISPSSLAIIFRKNISGITQRLGEITLTQDDSIELDILSWTSTAIERGDALETELTNLTAEYATADQTISALNTQLEELIAAKQAHDNALLAKFKELLNAKKLKIRDQQRLLAGANVRREHGLRVQAARGSAGATTRPGTARTPGLSNKGKRKPAEAALGGDRDGDDDQEKEAFEGPLPPRVKEEDEDDEMDGMDGMLHTPEAEDEDITEDEDGGTDRKGEEEEEEEERDLLESQRMQLDSSPPTTRGLPPDRGLPFGKVSGGRQSQTVQQRPQQAREEEDQETEDDDDDEL